MRYRLWLLRCSWQGWRARRRGDFDTGVNDLYGRFVITRAQAERLRDDLASGRIKTRKVRMLPSENHGPDSPASGSRR